MSFLVTTSQLRIFNVNDMMELQRYDGTSNMRGECNGLQALFLRKCSYTYYVHCFAHKLQSALVTASREAKSVHQLFVHLPSIINIVVCSSKHHAEFQSFQVAEIENLTTSNEIETGKGDKPN
jgi:hypothetical protein